MVEATYYLVDGYTTIKGMISKINVTKRVITIIKTDISFDDILTVKIEDE